MTEFSAETASLVLFGRLEAFAIVIEHLLAQNIIDTGGVDDSEWVRTLDTKIESFQDPEGSQILIEAKRKQLLLVTNEALKLIIQSTK